MDNNMENCVQPKEMTPLEAARALVSMKGLIGEESVGVGVWDAEIKSLRSGEVYGPQQLAVFGATSVVGTFGKRGDQDSEAAAMLFAIAFKYAEQIVEELQKGQQLPDSIQEALNSGDGVYRP